MNSLGEKLVGDHIIHTPHPVAIMKIRELHICRYGKGAFPKPMTNNTTREAEYGKAFIFEKTGMDSSIRGGDPKETLEWLLQVNQQSKPKILHSGLAIFP